MPRQAVGSRGHNHGLRVQPLQGQETNFHGQRAQKRLVGQEWSGIGKMGTCFPNCLCVPFTHFSNGFLAFFLLTYRSSSCDGHYYLVMICKYFPQVVFALNNAYGILPKNLSDQPYQPFLLAYRFYAILNKSSNPNIIINSWFIWEFHFSLYLNLWSIWNLFYVKSEVWVHLYISLFFCQKAVHWL